MANNETIADIIAEMRSMGNYQRYSGDHARVLANRLEAAHKRELSKNVSKNGADFGQLGDCAKLREAVGYLYHVAKLCTERIEEERAAMAREGGVK